jgi:predicted Zn-dependent protease with MMP-like domain
MTDAERNRFDELLDRVLRDLPASVRELFDDAPLIIDDRPTRDMLEEFELDGDDDTLCGLYSGTPMTDRSFDGSPMSPDHIYIFREGIVQHAGGWEEDVDDEGKPTGGGGEEAIAREIRITVLHELGHHFGLDEDDLMKMGYD